MITVSSVAKSYGARVLFRDVSLQIVPGRRIALVGHNGTGKTTLLEMIAGELQPDEGTITRPKDVAVGFLRQEVAEPERDATTSVVEAVLEAADEVRALERRMHELEAEVADRPPGPELDALLEEYGRVQHRYEHLGGYGLEAEARKVLAGLGFSEQRMDAPVAELSGGWMMRVALARLLLSAPDVLLLDEPTNHLDLASVTWLESFLAVYEGAVVVVSHDRDFINAVANRVVELAGQTASEYVGDYAAFVEQRAQRMEALAAAARNQQRKIAQTERFIERFRYKATKARQVQSRIKALEKLERIEAPRDEVPRMRFRFPPPPRAGREVVRLEGVSKRFGDHVVYDRLDLVLERGRKVALVGPNGAGKTTLLRLLAGVLEPDQGRRLLGHNVSVAYYAQHQVDALDLDKTVLQELSAVVDTSTVNPRSMLGAFLFRGDDVDKRVGVLSGGEKSRLALAKLLAAPVNLLCMDEPTNHLDIASRDVLEDALLEYPGTVVLITHDRHLIRSVADTIVEVGGGTATVYPGDFEYYAAKTGLDLDGSGAAVPQAGAVPDGAAGQSRGRRDAEERRAEAERRNRRYRATKELRRQLEKVEAELGAAEAEVAELTRALADPEVYGDGERVKELVAAHGAAKDRAAALFADWERLSLAVEEAAAAAEEHPAR
ncbi:MAG TPA: ABC-F family ATP-binding cassette domain-containing protein [Egibacteraceae bacterium]